MKPADTVGMLRAVVVDGKGLSKDARAVISHAADQLDALRAAAADTVDVLEAASALRIGQMDSQSKADEVQTRVRSALTRSVDRLRPLL